jgi:hypothetical protein
MEYTVLTRKTDYLSFMNSLSNLLVSVNKKGEFLYDNIISMFKSKKISSGIEGSVYLSSFKHTNTFNQNVIIKQLKLKNIKKTKTVYNYIINASPQVIYKLFETYKIFKQPVFIEIVSQTLTNQLILQNICPNFSMNYYWEFDNITKTIYSYNEFANYGDFDYWAKHRHSEKLWFNALFQIMFGLICIKKYFNMIHSDFHTKNILVKQVESGGYWLYIINNTKYYVPNLGYVFLIHDLGFSWIPKKLYVKWHVDDTLSHLTKPGVHFYDIATFVHQIIHPRSKYIIPKSFKTYISNMFDNETQTVFNKSNITTSKPLSKSLFDKFLNINFNYSTPPLNQLVIDTFSADKSFDKTKIPSNFHSLIL